MTGTFVLDVVRGRLTAWILVVVVAGLGANTALGQSYFQQVDPEEKTFRLAANQEEDAPQEEPDLEADEVVVDEAAAERPMSNAERLYDMTIGNRGVDDLFNIREAYPDALEGVFVLDLRFKYSTQGGQDDDFELQQRLEYGITDKISVGFAVLQPNLGDGGDSGAGDIEVGAFWQINDEQDWIPVFALSADMRIPSGDGSSGVDGTFNFIMTKSFGDKFRAHLQGFVETANGSSGAATFDRRHFQWGVGAGADYLLFDNTTVAMNYQNRANEEYGQRNQNLLQLGVVQNVGKLGNTYHAVSFVNTIGLDGIDSTPNFEALFQWSINIGG
jgi:hypothetical protein